jgi:hypothetical protein
MRLCFAFADQVFTATLEDIPPARSGLHAAARHDDRRLLDERKDRLSAAQIDRGRQQSTAPTAGRGR